MHMAKIHNQRGAISMLTVIFLALLLTIITTSFVRLSITEQRQAVDDDLTTRAFYAAESGVEDAKRAISDFQNGTLTQAQLNETECTPAEVVTSGQLSADLDTEYTCQYIDLAPADYQASLDAWQAVTVPLSGASAFSSVRIDWHIHDGGAYARHTNQDLLTVGAWQGADYPAMLRAAVFSTPSSASFSSSQVSQSTMFINPSNGGGSTNINSSDGQIVNGNCVSSPSQGQYSCSMTLAGINSGRTNYLRLQSLYRQTNISITLLDSSNNPVLLDDVQALIDVTGRAGDVFRRVEARVSLLDQNFPLPDIALWSNTEICKDFSVTDDVADYSNTCPWAN